MPAVAPGPGPAESEHPLAAPLPGEHPAEDEIPEDSPLAAQAQSDVVIPGDMSAAGTLGVDILGAAASLGGAAGCRGPQFSRDDHAPPLAGFEIHGELLEDADIIHAFIESAVSTTKAGTVKVGILWSEGTGTSVRWRIERVHCRVDLLENTSADGIHLVLGLRPSTVVRHVEVHGNLSLLELGRDPIFREDIVRRLRLRAGDPIDDDPDRRQAALDGEKQRLLEYLARRGYFDAQVEVTALIAEKPYEVTLRIDLNKGAGYTMGKVEVTGNHAVSSDEIADLMTQRVCPLDICIWNGRFSYDRLKADLEKVKTLYQSRGFPAVHVRSDFSLATSPDRESKTVRLKLTIGERKKIDVVYEDVHHKSQEDLKSALTFNADGAYDDFAAASSAEVIRRHYQGDGRFQTLVSFARKHEDTDHDIITFHVHEGPELKIQAIEIVGNTTFPAEKLATVISARPFPGFYGLLGSGGYVTSLQLQLDVDALVSFYQSQGFAHARADVQVANHAELLGNVGAVAGVVTSHEEGENLYLRYTVVEGPRNVVGATDFTGNKAIPTAELVKLVKLHPGVPFAADDLSTDADNIRRLYLKRGYLTASVQPTWTGSGPDVKVVYKVREGQPIKFGKLIVRGNFKTDAWVVASELGLSEGDILSIDSLDRGTFQLRSTNLFAAVHPPQLIGRDPVNVVIDVEERYDNLADAEVGGGYSTDFLFFVSGTFGLRDIGGTGADLVLVGQLGQRRSGIQATLDFPQWLMYRSLRIPFKLELSARYRVDQDPRLGELTTEGFTATFSRKLATGISLSVKYDVSKFGRSTELIRPAGIDQDLTSSPVTTTTASLGPSILIDRRLPSALTPSEGYLVTASASVASTYLLGTDDFIKMDFAGQYFLPIGKRVVITNTFRYDQGFPLGGSVLLPEVERFHGGRRHDGARLRGRAPAHRDHRQPALADQRAHQLPRAPPRRKHPRHPQPRRADPPHRLARHRLGDLSRQRRGPQLVERFQHQQDPARIRHRAGALALADRLVLVRICVPAATPARR